MPKPRGSSLGVIVVITQTYPPDTPAVGQHMADLAAELGRRGYGVTVLTADRGYDDPSVRLPTTEARDGVRIRRLPLSSLGKDRMAYRMLAAVLFGVQCFWHTVRTDGLQAVVFSTSPPFIGTFAGLAARLRRVPTAFWIMDLVPDLLFASGRLEPRSPLGRLLEALTRRSLRSASVIVALDRYMQERVMRRGIPATKVVVIPPWSPDVIADDVEDGRQYREEHNMDGETIVMYSGNHSLMNPLDTLLHAAERLRAERDIKFFFVGGGTARRSVEQFVSARALDNVVLATSVPVDRLASLLAAADVHVVTLGDPMVGIIHPCKVYGAMAAARPILYVGPDNSHVKDLMDHYSVGWHVRQGDVSGMVEAVLAIHRTDRGALRTIGDRGRMAIRAHFAPRRLCGRVADAVENTVPR